MSLVSKYAVKSDKLGSMHAERPNWLVEPPVLTDGNTVSDVGHSLNIRGKEDENHLHFCDRYTFVFILIDTLPFLFSDGILMLFYLEDLFPWSKTLEFNLE